MMTPELRPGTWDEDIWNLVNGMNEYRVNRFAGKIVVDIGAHIGAFSRLAADNGATIVHAFEPNKNNYKLLLKNTQYTQIKTYNLAVHCNSGLLVNSIEDASGNTGSCGVVLSPDGTGTPTISMDDIIDLAGYVHILKMDCEGGEYPGLLKCTKLNRVDAIVGEYHPHAYGTIEDLKKHLHENQFNVGTQPTADGLGYFFAVRI